MGGTSYTYNYQYDSYGRQTAIDYPGSFGITLQYDGADLTGVKRNNGDDIWAIGLLTAKGHLSNVDFGPNQMMSTRYTYDSYDRLTDIQSYSNANSNLQHFQYTYDDATGNMLSRADVNAGMKENFEYDDVFKNRLSRYYKSDMYGNFVSNDVHMTYHDNNGSIKTKTGVGTYQYNQNTGGGVHAVSQIENTNGWEPMPQKDLNITYTPFNKISQVVQKGITASVDKKLEVTYGMHQERKKTEYSVGTNVQETKTYVGNLLEIETDAQGNQTWLHYIPGLSGEAAIYRSGASGNNGEMYYLLKDHLGSYTGVVTESGNIATYQGVAQKFNYDPWGRRRNPNDWTYNNVPDKRMFDRGFTGHEHLDELGIINMNGRVYDPVLGTFLSPDNYVQDPFYSQNFNRYQYCLNNPLIYTDPTGEKWWKWAIADVLTGGAISTTAIVTYETAVMTIPAVQSTVTAIDHTRAGLQTTYNLIQDIFNPGDHIYEDDSWIFEDLIQTIKIDAGLILHIPGWETDQALAGNLVAHYRNINGEVDNVEIKNWTVLVNDNNPDDPGHEWGMTLGPYINSMNMEIDDDMYKHELGHTIQSRIIGPYYMSKVGIPSSLTVSDDAYHEQCWYEVSASRLGGANTYPNQYRENDDFWYWFSIFFSPFITE